MLQTKIIPVTETDETESRVNEFMQNHVLSSYSFRDAYIALTYDDGAPINDIQRAANLRIQIAKTEDALQNAEIQYSLSMDNIERAEKDLGKDKIPQQVLDIHEQSRVDMFNAEKIVAKLKHKLATYGN